MIWVATINDQPLFTDGLGRMIGAQPETEVVGTAHDGESGVNMHLDFESDVVLSWTSACP